MTYTVIQYQILHKYGKVMVRGLITPDMLQTIMLLTNKHIKLVVFGIQLLTIGSMKIGIWVILT